MPYGFPSDIDQQVQDRISTGRYENENEVLRAALDALRETDADLAAIEWKAGDEGLPVDGAFAVIRGEQQEPGLQ